MKRKVLVVFGTRPEAIKMAPVVKALQKLDDIIVNVCVTGQHRQMLDQVLDIFSIEPGYDLNIMSPAQTLNTITSSILNKLPNIFDTLRPDLVLVHGDTTSALATALAAYYHRIPIGHVEAGLRTNDIYSPWPEEGNRAIIAKLATLNFAPTVGCKINLLNDGVSESKIFVTGNTVIDSLHIVLNQITNLPVIKSDIIKKLVDLEPSIDLLTSKWESGLRRLILITGHRRENFGDGIFNLCDGLLKVSKAYPDVDIVYPVHMNPNVESVVREKLAGCENIRLLPPLDYTAFVYLMSVSKIILTDSGGIQEEAPSLGVPVLVMREVTERLEALDAGTVKLIGMKSESIFQGVVELFDDRNAYLRMANAVNPYGDGTAGDNIAQFINDYFNVGGDYEFAK